jgi:predicted ATPase
MPHTPSDFDAFRLTRVRLRQYRSIAECDVRLGPLTILVGPNGSGKSNFLDALRLVAESLRGSLDQALRGRGGIGEVRRRTGSGGRPPHVGIQVEYEDEDGTGEYGIELAATAKGSLRVAAEWASLWLRSRDGEGERHADARFFVRDGRLVEHTTEAYMPQPSGQGLYLVLIANLDAFRPLYEGLAGISVHSIDPVAMRQPRPPGQGVQLDRDGANIAAVLHRLESEGPPGAKERIEQYLGLIVPGLSEVHRADVGAWDTLEFVQGGQTFPALSASDGTLRALGVLTALFAGADGEDGPAGPVGIEEPENALHPAASEVLVDALRDAAEHRQVIVTTHSPDLLEHPALGAEQLLAVRQEDGTTAIGAVDRASARALSEELFTAGELLRADQLQPSKERGGSSE